MTKTELWIGIGSHEYLSVLEVWRQTNQRQRARRIDARRASFSISGAVVTYS